MLARVEVSWKPMPTFEMSAALWGWGRGRHARMFQHENGHYILHHAAALTEMKRTMWWECRQDTGDTCIYIHLHTHWLTHTECIIIHLQTSWTEVESAKETDNEKNIDLRMLSDALLPKAHYWSWATCIAAVGIQCFHCYLLGYNSLLTGWTELAKVSHITGLFLFSQTPRFLFFSTFSTVYLGEGQQFPVS